MAWLRAADTEVKRDMEISRDEVRVMTVHGAKGLEASVVFLVDTTTSPSDTQRLRLINLPQGNAGPHAPGIVVWAGRKAEDPPAVAAARAAMLGDTEDEYRRLLYVAMTRAADRLIVGGCMPGNRKDVRPSSWYDLIAKGLDTFRIAARGDQDTERRRETLFAGRGSRARHADPALRRQRRASIDAAIVAADAGAAGASGGRVCCARPIPLTTTAIRCGQANRSCRAPRRSSAARWCTGCCNRCPISPPNAAARPRCRISPATPTAGPRTNGARWRTGAVALIADPRFAHAFAPGSQAEVSIVGRLDRPGQPPALVSGQIDRLVVTERRGFDRRLQDQPRPAARPRTRLPRGYVRQLALYRAVLAKLYPQLPVRAALLWTETPDLMEISAPALDAALASYHLGVTALDPARSRS